MCDVTYQSSHLQFKVGGYEGGLLEIYVESESNKNVAISAVD